MAGKKTNIKNKPPVSAHPDWDAVFQIIHEPAMIVSPDFNILHANLATQEAFGLSEQQLQGRNCYEVFHGTKTPPTGCPLAKLMATGRAQTTDLEVEMLRGNYRVSCTPILDENGKIKSIFHLASDITERVQAEQVLQRHALQNSTILETALDGFWLVDSNTQKIVDVNEAYCRMSGYSRDEILKMTIPQLEALEQPDEVNAHVARIMDKKADRFETLHRRKDGSKFFVDISVQYLGETGKLFAFLRDITERKQVEERLQEKQTQLQAVLDYSPALISIKDLNGNIMLANRSFAVLDAPPLNEFVGRNVFEVFPADVAEKLWENDLAALRAGTPVYSEEVVGHKDGTLHTYFTVKFPIYVRSDQPFGICAISNDITGRKQTEDALRINQEMFSLFMRYSPIHVYIKEVTPTKSHVLQASDNFQEMIGIDGREMIGKTMEELFPAEFAAKMTADDWAVVANGNVLKVDEDLNGRHYTSVKFPIVQGDKTLLAGYTIDITERVQAEEKIQKIARHYQALIEKAPDGIVLLNEQGYFKFASPSAKIMFGFGVSEEMTGSPAQYTHPDDLPLVLSELGRLLEDPSYVPTLQYRYSDKNGNWKWVESTFSNLLSDPSVESIVINFREITERKQAENEIHQLNAELEQRVEDRTHELREAQEKLVRHEKLVVLGQMSSSVGHELRNPLSVINSAIYYLKMIQPNASDDVKEYLDIIDQEVHTAEKIITDLLDFARIKSVDREAVSVSDLIRHTLERFPVPESVAVTIEIPPDLPQVFVDVHHITQVLGNLTVNACQAMTSSNESTLIVGQLSLYSTVQNDMINITVKDNGVGISAENMKKIFEPLFTTKTKGIGLGLAVSQKLVDANDGRIEVESEAGRGTSFHVYLPIYRVVPVIARDEKESE